MPDAITGATPITDTQRQIRLTDEFIAVLRQRVDSRYYDQPQIIELIARAILVSREIYY